MSEKKWGIQYCKCCENENEEWFPGFPGYCYSSPEDEEPICPRHNVPMEVIDFPADDFKYIRESGGGNDFLRAMIELRKTDIIEYQTKLAPFKKMYEDRTNREYSEYLAERRAEKEASIPKCPTCGSKDIRKIGVGERAASIGFFGIFSKKINKTWKCQNCGHTW